ncbi:3-deoxy-D-manno-octulosonic-acid transferase [Breoghania corrubedonensis]|uniref:3-deoxy-D-manno-octulosonic acid transferase n=1 Tax=Breoghania corrubedonensis TaxID=665038 RepID=A0A2T5VEU6_9HYPH|nr:3-deoxy-D-manno-octulosonic acid transferase [Breoghania corrubedonensis]PTW62273.1 3-deoxy-D-manno-octulosonic-acid transferase [Breoghania corrubedonensis]
MAEAGSALLTTYRLAGRLSVPALGLLYARRVRAGKEDPARRGERFGHSGLTPGPGSHVWVHAASVGETNAVLPLIEWIVGQGYDVVLTTGTVTSARLAAERLPEGAVHQFVPYDVAPLVSRFLETWRPKLAIMVESEIWPATFSELASRHIPTVVVNGRMSERSCRGWARLGAGARAIFGCITLCLAQSEADARRYAMLGARTVRSTGNLKFDVPPLPFDEAARTALATEIGARPVWIAASTHPGEEEMLADVHRALRPEVEDLLLISVPRHPERGREVAEIFARAGHDVSLRSRGEAIRRGSNVYVADTIGELGLFYRLASLAFIGGSLVPHGGQNPIEPAQIGCVVLSGPHVRNFSGIYRSLGEAGGARIVKDGDSLRTELATLLDDDAAAAHLARAAHDCALSGQGALAAVKSALESELARLMD